MWNRAAEFLALTWERLAYAHGVGVEPLFMLRGRSPVMLT
jgi:hypothetical protein